MPKKKKASKRYLVFISHSAKDRWTAQRMADRIEQQGRKYQIKTFLDERDIEGGESIPETIKNNIRKSNEFLVLISRNSKDRAWVQIEIGAAWILGKRMIAIIDNISPKEMPDVIVLRKAIDLNDFENYVNQLLRRASKIGGRT